MNLPDSFVAFDLETTGFAPPSSRIIEFGAVKIVHGCITDTWQTFVNPDMPIPPAITRLTGIDDLMVCSAPFVEEALPAFLQFADGLPLAAHNARFDMTFVEHDAKRLGLQIRNAVIDTVPLARRLYPRLANHKLGTVARHLNAVQDQEHRGLDDARVVAAIVLNGLERLRMGRE